MDQIKIICLKFGISIANYGEIASRRFLKDIVTKIESAGLDSVWTSDHIIVPKENRPWTRVYETIVTLSFFASITERVQLGTSILLVALRDPLLLGKQIASLDSLCNGRLMIGVGIGWNADEYKILGKDFVLRSKIVEDSILKMKRLWSGNYLKEGYISEPEPLQKNGPPILIGGQSKAALRRVASIGDGWHPVGITIDTYKEGKKLIMALRRHDYIWSLRIGFDANRALDSRYVGTDGKPRVRLVGNTGRITEEIEEYEKAGVQHIICDIREISAEKYIEQIKILSQIKDTFN